MIELLPSQRPDFAVPRDVVWLNTAQMSIQHNQVAEAGQLGLARKQTPWTTTPADFFNEIEQARALFARLIKASVDDIAIVPSCSYGIATAAKNLPVTAGQRILATNGQFPSNIYAWKRRAAEQNAALHLVERDATDGLTQPLMEALTEQTAVVACGAVHWSDATPIDLAMLSKQAKAVGAALVLDMTQFLGAVPFDVQQIDPDFLVCPLYKWMLGPYSLGFMYVAPRWQQGVPLEENWSNRADAENFAGLVDYTGTYAAGARRFDMGEKSNFGLMPMAVAALELLHQWQPERIAASLQAINARLITGLAERGFIPPVMQQRSPHYFGVRLPAHAPTDLAIRLAQEQVFVSVRGDKMRISPHLWIDEQDEARFFECLDKHLG